MLQIKTAQGYRPLPWAWKGPEAPALPRTAPAPDEIALYSAAHRADMTRQAQDAKRRALTGTAQDERPVREPDNIPAGTARPGGNRPRPETDGERAARIWCSKRRRVRVRNARIKTVIFRNKALVA